MGQGQTVLEVIEEAEQAILQEEEKLIRLSTGVILRPMPISPLLLDALARKYKPPKPPQIKNEENGRFYENIDDPEWLDKKAELEDGLKEASTDIMIARGTELVSTPKGFSRPEEKTWAEDLEMLTGLTVEKHPKMRYLAWVKYEAAPATEDITAMVKAVLGRMGVPEQLVAEQLDGFPGDEARLPDSGSGTETPPGSGTES